MRVCTHHQLLLGAVCVTSACSTQRARARPNVDIMSVPPFCQPAPPGPSTPIPRVPSLVSTPDSGFATVVGVVTDDPAGGALAGAGVWARPVGRDSATRSTPRELAADAFGGFVITHLLPGQHELRARRVGYVARTRRFTARAGRVDTIRMQLRAAPECRGY